MKLKRHEAILDIIAENAIETQEDLIAHLKAFGFEVTQATISRDIRELKLTKVSSGHGSYRYTLPPKNDFSVGMKFNSALVDSIVFADYALNNIVIKTFPGLANAVAAGIDGLKLPEILGCVAGDDTIIAVACDIDAAKNISEKIKVLMKA